MPDPQAEPIVASIVETPKPPEWPSLFYWQDERGFIAYDRFGYRTKECAAIDHKHQFNTPHRLVFVPGTADVLAADKLKAEREACAKALDAIEPDYDSGAFTIDVEIVRKAARLLRTP